MYGMYGMYGMYSMYGMHGMHGMYGIQGYNWKAGSRVFDPRAESGLVSSLQTLTAVLQVCGKSLEDGGSRLSPAYPRILYGALVEKCMDCVEPRFKQGHSGLGTKV